MAANDTAVDGAVDGAGNRPQIYLISPPDFTLETFSGQLARVLDQVETACVRLALAGSDEDRIGRACDALRQIAHERDVALVIENHIRLAERHGLDGVHLSDGARHVRLARKELGGDAIVGAFSGRSRHDGLTAGEAGADYVAFGPVGVSALGLGEVVGRDLLAWWSEMIEVPVVCEGGLSVELIETLAPVTDFFGIGAEIWAADDPAKTLKELLAPLG
ncbi:MAG: thiamine phosphate synthase [Rhodobacteraceae bacterium]|nr:thiamine phosphate synthase [Paracoccaceae bacterium]MCP5340912.1 thiamine phosphate synthase [Paracoccaceae bacterium]